MAYAATLLSSIPETCRRAAAAPDGAQGIIFALVMSSRPEVRQRQLARLAASAPGNVYARLTFIEAQCAGMPAAARLPHLPREEYQSFRENLLALVTADNELDLFEFTLLQMVGRRLDRHFGLAAAPREQFGSLDAARDSVAVVRHLAGQAA